MGIFRCEANGNYSSVGFTAKARRRRKDAKMYEPTEEENRISSPIVDAALTVHRALGPGLLESVYEKCLVYELSRRRTIVARQVLIPVVYEDLRIGNAFRMDLLVGDLIIVEVKAVETVPPLFKAQLLAYLKLSGRHLGLLINFNVARIKEGIQRVVLSTN